MFLFVEQVVKARFGLNGALPRTLEEVGRDFRLTRERVRQIEARALHKLRQPYRNYRVRDFKLDQMLVQAGVLPHPTGTIKAARLAVSEAEAAAKRNEVAMAHHRMGTLSAGAGAGRVLEGTTVGMGGGVGIGGDGGGDTTGIASELQSILGARYKEKEAARLLREGGGGEEDLEGLPRHEPLLDVGLGGGAGGGGGLGPASELLRKQQEQLQVEEEDEDEDDGFEFEDEYATVLNDKFDDDFEDDFEDDLAATVFDGDGSEGGAAALKSTAPGQGGASMDAVRTLNKAWTNTANSLPREAADQLSIMGVSVAPRSPDEEQEQLLSTLDSLNLLDDEEEGSTTENAMDRLQSEMKVTPMSLGERAAAGAGERAGAGAVAATSRSLQAA